MDISLDLETTGTSAGCGILSIGACTFDRSEKFYEKIDINSCLEAGLVSNIDTINWWNKQAEAARKEAFSGTKSLVMVLGEFSDWYKGIERVNGDSFIWGNGADFDLPILGAAYEAVGMKKPWKPFNGRCYRTLKNLFFEVKAEKFEGIKHTALSDAEYQAIHAVKILREWKALKSF